MIRRLFKSEALRSAIWFGAGGVGFAAGNVLLARELSPESFGVIALALALNQFGLTFGPCGIEMFANRHRPRIGSTLIRLVFSTSTIAGLVVGAVAHFYYHLSPTIVVLIIAMSIGSATNRVGSALFQGGQQLPMALVLSQVHNYILLLAAILIMVLAFHSNVFALSIVTAGYAASAVLGWLLAYRYLNSGRSKFVPFVALREGLAALGVGVAVEVLGQFERLAIPKVGSMEMLSTYAVLTAVAGSPFRMLQIGTSFSLLPRLRAATTAAVARGVLLRESAVALSVALAAGAFITLFAPYLFKVLFGGKYDIPLNLVAASVIVGLTKLWQSLAVTIVTACGTTRALATISIFAWICLGVAAVATVIGSRFGLVGILYGVGFAWALLASGATYLATACFRARFAA